jgi:hypothetical protein
LRLNLGVLNGFYIRRICRAGQSGKYVPLPDIGSTAKVTQIAYLRGSIVDWTIQDLGAIGEFVSAIVVVFTVAYLAVQIRQNTKSVNVTNSNSIMQGFNFVNATLMADPELIRAYRQGLVGPDQLDPVDRARFMWSQHLYNNIYRNMYHQYLDGTFSEAAWLPWAREAKQNMETPGGLAFRAHSKTYEDLFEYLSDLPDVVGPVDYKTFLDPKPD